MTSNFLLPEELFTPELGAVYAFLGFERYPAAVPTVEEAFVFKAEVEAHWETALAAFQKARGAWSKARLELLSLQSAKVKKEEAIEAKEAEVAQLREVFDSTYEVMLNGRRLEEITRALPASLQGVPEATRFLLRQLETVRAYTPGLPPLPRLS